MSPPTDIAAFFSSLFRQLPQHHFLEAIKICQRAGKHAAIDMSALSPPALSATTEQLSVFFEIENRFSPISIKENSQFDRFLFEKGIELNINEMPFVIRLSSYGEIVYSQFAHCIARLECPECWHKYLSPHREIHAYLQLTEKFNNFRIPVNTYNYIVRSCQAQMEEKFDAISSMLLHEFEECIAIFDGVKLSSLEGVFPVSISELMANIERAYQDFYPEIAQLWKC
ncbi:MAG: hypothetical protein OEZ43_07945 [Gammaproteobacteria bacterium]|nr:hypothetical protein [Gammaproteobacteria bacterium]